MVHLFEKYYAHHIIVICLAGYLQQVEGINIVSSGSIGTQVPFRKEDGPEFRLKN